MDVVLIVLGLMMLLAGGVFQAQASGIWWSIVDRVNARLPENTRETYLWWDVFKYDRVMSVYRREYPDGELRSRYHRAALIGVACSIAGMMTFGWGISLRAANRSHNILDVFPVTFIKWA